MAAGQRPVCECPEPCACYAAGYAAGSALAGSLTTFNDPAEHPAVGLSPHVAIDTIRAAALRAIRQTIGEDYGPDAEEDSQGSSQLIARLLIGHSRGPELSLAEAASLVAEATSAGTEVGLSLARDKQGQREQ